MKFMIFVCHGDDFAPPPEVEGETQAWVEEMERRGVRLTGSRLQPDTEARAVRVRDGELVVEKGPVVAGDEHLAGFDILECSSLQEAVDVVAQHPMATWGSIEVREYWEA